MKKSGLNDLSKQELREKLERDVAKFFAKGGKKTELKPEHSDLYRYPVHCPRVVGG